MAKSRSEKQYKPKGTPEAATAETLHIEREDQTIFAEAIRRGPLPSTNKHQKTAALYAKLVRRG